jgi:hypothetical protein
MSSSSKKTEVSSLLPVSSDCRDCELGTDDRDNSMERWESEYLQNKRVQWFKLLLMTVVITVLSISAYIVNFQRTSAGSATSLTAYHIPYEFVRDEDGHFALTKTDQSARYKIFMLKFRFLFYLYEFEYVFQLDCTIRQEQQYGSDCETG